ncbi:MAG: metalloregulator ArsR/SmtB family transcription factor [Kiritimatiellales bacterium]|nr:metalloregulator ArsR/SmtB family transcription factor [Kiritimatiellales bacterium]
MSTTPIPTLEKQLRAISHFRKLHILRLIKKNKAMTVSEIADEIGIKPFPVSQHLRILKNAGILQSKKRGRYVSYRLSLKQTPVVKDILRYL